MMLCRALDAVPGAAAGLRKIDAADEQREFFVAESDPAFLAPGFRPAESALLKAFRADPEAAAVPEQQLEAV